MEPLRIGDAMLLRQTQRAAIPHMIGHNRQPPRTHALTSRLAHAHGPLRDPRRGTGQHATRTPGARRTHCDRSNAPGLLRTVSRSTPRWPAHLPRKLGVLPEWPPGTRDDRDRAWTFGDVVGSRAGTYEHLLQ